MRIITWNCNMAFRKKASIIISEKPDIIIVPESESPEKLNFSQNDIIPNDMFWFGDNINKGIGVYSYSDFKISLLKEHNPDFRFVIPLSIRNNDLDFILLAIWSQKPNHSDNYGLQTWNALNFYDDLLQNKKVIISGDLNSSSIWDKPKREANHTNIVNHLNDKNIKSSYHLYFNEEQGKEKQSILHLHRKINRPYHIDFCFTSTYFTNRLQRVQIGTFEKWMKYSDHKPLIVDFDLSPLKH